MTTTSLWCVQERIKAQFPANMSARFSLGSRLAEECGAVGCTGDLGYQTFLYPAEKEIRLEIIDTV